MLTKEEIGYIAAFKWYITRRLGPPVELLMPPTVLPAFDIVRMEGDDLTRIATIPAEVLPARVEPAEPYASIGFSGHLYLGGDASSSADTAKATMQAFEV